MITVSDKISHEEIRTWKKGEIITISAPTGSGKSYFIKNGLSDYAKINNEKILFLVPRTLIKNQFEEELIEKSIVTIMTYQSLESFYVRNSCHKDLSEYDYIFCDEAHYFISDASFNNNTDISFNMIINQSNKKVIMSSATGDLIIRYLKKVKGIVTRDYSLPISYDFINYILFYENDQQMKLQAKNCIDNDIKAIFFINNVKKAYDLHCEFKGNTMFVCGDSQEEFASKMDRGKLKRFLENERFEETILITTSALDTGVNIIDSEIKFILLDVIDSDTAIQCLGRKRRNDNTKINVMWRIPSIQVISGHKGNLTKEYDKAKYLKDNGQEQYIKHYYRNPLPNIIYIDFDGKLKVNELVYINYLNRINEYHMMDKYSKQDSYPLYIAEKKLGLSINKFDILNEKKTNIENCLKSLVGSEIFMSEDRKPLIKKLNLRRNGKILSTARSINIELEKVCSNYRIYESKERRIVNGISKVCNIWTVNYK